MVAKCSLASCLMIGLFFHPTTGAAQSAGGPTTASTTARAFHTWAPTPPMGWNSWDVYGSSVTEQEVKANADYMAKHLREFGWEYAVVDIRWYVDNPARRPYNKTDPKFIYDEFGRPLPSPTRFPSSRNGAGFKPLADYLHSKGLKLGVHMMRGINKEVWHADLPIKGTSWSTRDITRREGDEGATWLPEHYGMVRDEISQAYLDSIFELYAEWGVDYVKIDDMLRDFAHPDDSYYKETIEQVRQAIDKCGRPIVLSLSPGGAPLAQAEHLVQHANLWRITDDFWDKWPDLKVMFERAHEWTPYRGPGHWPDCDMLPLGRIAIRGERGEERQSNFTRDEQITLMTLWSIAKSPLMFGGDLPSIETQNDTFTRSLLTNPEVLAVNQHSTDNRQLFRRGDHVAWVASVPDEPAGRYLAVFNLGDEAATVEVALGQLDLGETLHVRDLWARADLDPATGRLQVELPAHGAALYKLSRIP